MRIGIVCYPTFGGSGVLATELFTDFCNVTGRFEADAAASLQRGSDRSGRLWG